jgi:hypothetical protein
VVAVAAAADERHVGWVGSSRHGATSRVRAAAPSGCDQQHQQVSALIITSMTKKTKREAQCARVGSSVRYVFVKKKKKKAVSVREAHLTLRVRALRFEWGSPSSLAASTGTRPTLFVGYVQSSKES